VPNRILREGINTSPKINSLSEEAELFYRRLFAVVDDYGLYLANLTFIRANVFLARYEAWTEDRIERCLQECVAAELIILYCSSGIRHLQIENFNQQHKSKPKYPFPPKADPVQGELRLETRSDIGPVPVRYLPSESESVVRGSESVVRSSSSSVDAGAETTDRPTTPVEIPKPSAPRIGWIRSALSGYMAQEWGAPDDGICRQIDALLSQHARGDPEQQLKAVLQAKLNQGKRPGRSWAWFVSVIRGELQAQAQASAHDAAPVVFESETDQLAARLVERMAEKRRHGSNGKIRSEADQAHVGAG